MKLGQIFIDNLPLISSMMQAVTLSGSIRGDGDCKGSPYSDVFRLWSDVIVHGNISITLNDYSANVDTNTDTIKLQSGLTCKTSLNGRVDIKKGYTV